MSNQVSKIKEWLVRGSFPRRGNKAFVVLFLASYIVSLIITPFQIIVYAVWFIPLLFLSGLIGLGEVFFNHQEPLPGLDPIGWLVFIVFWFLISYSIGWLYGKRKEYTRLAKWIKWITIALVAILILWFAYILIVVNFYNTY